MNNNTKEALQVLKTVLDMATAKGVFTNVEASYTAATAFNIINKALENDTTSTGNNTNNTDTNRE